MRAVSDGISIVLVEGGVDEFRKACRGLGLRDAWYRDLPVVHYELPTGPGIGYRLRGQEWLQEVTGEEMDVLQRGRFKEAEPEPDQEWRLGEGERLR